VNEPKNRGGRPKSRGGEGMKSRHVRPKFKQRSRPKQRQGCQTEVRRINHQAGGSGYWTLMADSQDRKKQRMTQVRGDLIRALLKTSGSNPGREKCTSLENTKPMEKNVRQRETVVGRSAKPTWKQFKTLCSELKNYVSGSRGRRRTGLKREEPTINFNVCRRGGYL